MLALRARLALRRRHLERRDQDGPRLPRLDHLVDVAALGRVVGVREALLVVRDQLGAGRAFCFLYTDLANPTSNKIYVAIGYRRICDSIQYAFV